MPGSKAVSVCTVPLPAGLTLSASEWVQASPWAVFVFCNGGGGLEVSGQSIVHTKSAQPRHNAAVRATLFSHLLRAAGFYGMLCGRVDYAVVL